MIQQTSLDAWDVVVPTLSLRKLLVLGVFQAIGDCCDSEGSKHSGITINSFVSRRNELVKEGFLCYKGIKENSLGRSVMLWGLSR